MTRTFTEAYLYGFTPDNPHAGSNNMRYADYVFTGHDVEFVDLSERASDMKDTAKVEVHNPNGIYTDEDADLLDHGDRVEFKVGRRPLREFGMGKFGTGLFQPDLALQWTGLIRNYSVEADGRHIYTLEFDAEDFPYAIMSLRRVTNAWEDEQILTGGDGQGIIDTILQNECPEIDRSALPSLSVTTSITLPDKNVLEAVVELANRAGVIMYAHGTTLHMEQPSNITTKFEMDTADYTLWSHNSNDDSLFNRVRVEGGENHEPDPNAQQTTHDAWKTVTKDTRIQHQTIARKGELERIEIYTDPTRTGSGEDYVIRIQQDDGGVPVAPNDQKSDIARKTLSHQFVAHGGWTSFIMPDHDLADPQPWILVESSGGTGQDVGIRNSDGALAYIAHYPYSVRTRRDDRASQDNYRLREDTLTNSKLKSLAAARDMGSAYLNRHSKPDVEFEFDVDSVRLHELEVGEVVRIELPQVDTRGRFVCIDKTTEWAGTHETATVTLRDLASL